MDSKTNGKAGTDVQTARKKEKNYMREEDIFLCRAWMTTSGDPEEDTDQTLMTFWGRVGEKYATLVGNCYVSRGGTSLPQRWSKIRTAVSKFCAIYKNIADQNSDGYTEQDMIKMALLAYKKEKRAKFKFLHCWSELRSSPKWNLIGDSKTRGKNNPQLSSLDEHTSLNGGIVCPVPTDMSLEQSDREKLAIHCEVKVVNDDVSSPCTEPTPITAVPMPVFVCSSGIIDFDPHNYTTTDVQAEASEQVQAKKKEKNYTREEDVFLCRAWMVTCKDSVKGKDESSIAVWERIVEKYVSLIGSNYVTRTEKSLTSRWHKLRLSVLRFCNIYKNIHDQNPGGYTEHEKINMARVTYKNERNEKFKFHHCWTVLRHSPKWNEMYSQEPIISDHISPDYDCDSPASMDTSLEQVEGKILEEQIVRCGEGQSGAAAEPSPLAASSRLSTLCTPVILARNTDSNIQDARLDVQMEVSEKVNTGRREKNFTQEEDISLCRARMANSADTSIEKDQSPLELWKSLTSSSTLWEKIGEAFLGLQGGTNHVTRGGHSLENRWSKIRNAVEKFCSIYKSITDQNYSDLDKINKAMFTFQKECKEKFRFLHCWYELKDSPQWEFEMTCGARYRRKQAPLLSQQSPSGEHFTRNDDYGSPMPTPMSLDQPQGQKLVVRKRKGQDVDTSSSDVEAVEELAPSTNSFWSRHCGEELLSRKHDLVRDVVMDEFETGKLKKIKGRDCDTGSSEVEEPVPYSQELVRELLMQKVKKLDEILEIKRDKWESKMMLIDPTTLPDGRRRYFEKLQHKILERVCGVQPPSN